MGHLKCLWTLAVSQARDSSGAWSCLWQSVCRIISFRTEGDAAPFEKGVRAVASLESASAISLGKARRGALGPGAGPAGWRLVLAAGDVPRNRAPGMRRRKDGSVPQNRGHPREPAGIDRRPRDTALTMVILAWRLRPTAAWRATIIAARRDDVSRSGADGSEMLLRGCGKGKALESKQPCKNARDHSAGQTPSFWCKLYHVGTETLLTVQIKATLPDESDIPRLLPN